MVNFNLPNSSISQDELGNILESIRNNSENITSLSNSYQNGISAIATKLTQCSISTANNASPSTMVNNIGSIYTNRYNQGITDGRVGYKTQTEYDNWGNQRYNDGITDGRVGYYSQAQYNQYGNDRYNAGVNAADARVNTASANYKGGYNAGVSYADGRFNKSSKSFSEALKIGPYSKGLVSVSVSKSILINSYINTNKLVYAFVPGSNKWLAIFTDNSDYQDYNIWILTIRNNENTYEYVDKSELLNIVNSVEGANESNAVTLVYRNI